MDRDILREKVLEILLDDPQAGRGTIAKLLGIGEKRVRPVIKEVKDYLATMHKEHTKLEDAHDELLEHSANKERANQKLRDQQRIERKIRAKIRVDNAILEYAEELKKLIEERHFQPITLKHENTGKKVGVFCLSDEHYNELIEIRSNSYDFKVAGKRLKKYVINAKKYFKAHDVTDVLVARLGDSVNSDRRSDELLNQAANRAKADFLAALLTEQVILDLNQDFNVAVTGVSGNESRVDKEHGRTSNMLTNNHDFTIHELLKVMFRNTDIQFVKTDFSENVVDVGGQRILFIHGDQVGKGDIERKVQSIKGKWASDGVVINYVVFGHIHSAFVGDMFTRSGSLCGANAYSDGALQLSSRASQVCLLCDADGIDGIKFDLQNTGELEGYDIDEALESYNAKSAMKAKAGDRRFFVVGEPI
jgi:predicted phosphodiesterase